LKELHGNIGMRHSENWKENCVAVVVCILIKRLSLNTLFTSDISPIGNVRHITVFFPFDLIWNN
jgi:hypothetical protein